MCNFFQLTILPDHSQKVVLRALQQTHDVLVERVHVLEQPVVARVVNLQRKHQQVSIWLLNGSAVCKVYPASVVNEAEVGLVSEVGFLELGVGRVLRVQLLDQRLVGRFREPTLLVDQRQQTHRLQADEILTQFELEYIISYQPPRRVICCRPTQNL